MTKLLTLIFLALLTAFCVAYPVCAQTTAFTYQGSLKDGAVEANGNYDFQFALFDAVSGGSQLGSTLTQNSVTVSNGNFSVSLDFGSQFPGANRFLEIRVRLTGQPSLTTLAPRQAVNSAPYSVKSLNAETVGGIVASGFIQNGTALQTASQNISGNAFFGGNIGIRTTTPDATLQVISPGNENAVHGSNSGNGFGVVGTSFGSTGVYGGSSDGSGVVGQSNTGSGVVGQSNTGLAGNFLGRVNISGNVGIGTTNPLGKVHVDGAGTGYAIIGTNTDGYGLIGSSNTNFGVYGSSVSGTGTRGVSETSIGVQGISTSGDAVYGSSFGGKGVFGSSTNGIGVYGGSDGNSGVVGQSNSNYGVYGITTSGTGVYGVSSAVGLTVAAIRGVNSASGGNGVIGEAGGGTGTGVYGVSTSATGYGVVGRNLFGGYAGVFDGILAATFLDLNQFPGGGPTPVCRNGGRLSTCSSSLRYKTNIERFDQGLSLLNKLHPITFDWKQGGMHDLGLGAEDVEMAEPLLVTYNDKGQVEGVKYDRVGVVLINAVKEQQAQIEAQKEKIKNQQTQIDELKQIVCSFKPDAKGCLLK